MTNNNFRYRFKFTKTDEMKFIGHLDFMVSFQRACKRADIPIAYSNGFNPHQLLNFASPLSLGYTSIGDYGEFQLTKEIPAEEIKERLNAALPFGVRILDAAELKKEAEKVMTSLSAAAYEIEFEKSVTPDTIYEKLGSFISQNEIIVLKKTKHKIEDTNIKPDIINITDISDNTAKLKAVVYSGSVRNLKPESIAEAFMIYTGLEFFKNKNHYTRLDMYMTDENGKLVGLLDGVEKI